MLKKNIQFAALWTVPPLGHPHLSTPLTTPLHSLQSYSDIFWRDQRDITKLNSWILSCERRQKVKQVSICQRGHFFCTLSKLGICAVVRTWAHIWNTWGWKQYWNCLTFQTFSFYGHKLSATFIATPLFSSFLLRFKHLCEVSTVLCGRFHMMSGCVVEFTPHLLRVYGSSHSARNFLSLSIWQRNSSKVHT